MKRLAATSVVACAPQDGVSPWVNRALKRSSQPWCMVPSICICGIARFGSSTADGRVVREQRVVTSRETLDGGVRGARASCGSCSRRGPRVSGWRRRSRRRGTTVVVADPNYAPMYGEVRRRVKTDRRDVAALAEANRRGWYRATHRRSAAQRTVQQILRSRRQLVRDADAGRISVLRALLRQEGYRLPSGSAAQVPARLRAADAAGRRWPRRSRRCGR